MSFLAATHFKNSLTLFQVVDMHNDNSSYHVLSTVRHYTHIISNPYKEMNITEEEIVLPRTEKLIQGITICKHEGYDRVLGAESALSP